MEDKISRLPDDLIHQILSLIDPKEAVQTSLLSTRWKHVWKSLSILNFGRRYFYRIQDFSKFVEQFLLHRDHQSDLSVINLNSSRCAFFTYGPLYIYLPFEDARPPHSIFTIQSLKHLSLTLTSDFNEVPKLPWNLPALTTLFLENISFRRRKNDGTSKSLDLFSNLLNLRNLTLINCHTDGLKVFNIISPQLEFLHISSPELFIFPFEFVISAPKLSSFKYKYKYNGFYPPVILISPNNLSCMAKIHLDIDFPAMWFVTDYSKERVYRDIVNIFDQFRDAKFLTLTLKTIQALSSVFKLLEHQQSPFRRLECLKIEKSNGSIDLSGFSGFPYAHVLTFLCNSSPSVVIINECSRFP